MATQSHPETARIYDLRQVRTERERAAKPAPQPVIERGAWYHAAAIREAEQSRK